MKITKTKLVLIPTLKYIFKLFLVLLMVLSVSCSKDLFRGIGRSMEWTGNGFEEKYEGYIVVEYKYSKEWDSKRIDVQYWIDRNKDGVCDLHTHFYIMEDYGEFLLDPKKGSFKRTKYPTWIKIDHNYDGYYDLFYRNYNLGKQIDDVISIQQRVDFIIFPKNKKAQTNIVNILWIPVAIAIPVVGIILLFKTDKRAIKP